MTYLLLFTKKIVPQSKKACGYKPYTKSKAANRT